MKDVLAEAPGVPASVATAAAERGLGEFIDARNWGGRGYIVRKLAASGAALVMMALIIGLLHFLYISSTSPSWPPTPVTAARASA